MAIRYFGRYVTHDDTDHCDKTRSNSRWRCDKIGTWWGESFYGLASVSDQLDDAGRLDGVVEEEVLVRRVAVGDRLDHLLGQNAADDGRD